MPRWYLAYFFLAAFDVLTISGSLWLNHNIVELFSASVTSDKEWAILSAELDELRGLAVAVNAPGNDVFDSHDVSKESGRLGRAEVQFDAQYAQVELAFNRLPQPSSDALLGNLEEVDRALSEMVAEANQIFRLFEQDKSQEAGTRMATMDRKYAHLTTSLSAVSTRIRSYQLADLRAQNEVASTLQKYEYLLALLLLVMVSAASLYGYKIHREMLTNAAEKQEIVDSLVEAKNEALTAGKAKTDFLTMMSHEIRTPMNGIIGVVELLMLTPLSPKQTRHATTIESSAHALLKIINDVLDFAKLEAGKLNTQVVAFDVLEVIEDALSSLAPVAHKKGLELLCDTPASFPERIEGDPNRLRQLLVNLIGNALKFTNEGSVRLRATTEEQPDDRLLLRMEITDTGNGISEADQARLFSSFTQLDNANNRAHTGTGLGLAICKRLLDAMGGEIGVRSTLGQGTTFWFTVPVGRVPTPANPERPPSFQKVLIIDDNKINRQILHEQLSGWQIPSIGVANGISGLNVLAEASKQGAPYPVVLLDYQMPGMNGGEIAAEIRKRAAELGTIKILLLTSVERSINEDTLLFDQYLVKPVTRHSLMRGLQNLTGMTAKPTAAPLAVVQSSTRLLLVEDNPMNQMITLEMLEQLGFNAEIASNGQEAVDMFREGGHDLVLMDCQMPVMDGYEATRQIRSENTSVPIVALTAHALAEAKDQAVEAGMSDYLTKPLTMGSLRAALQTWLPTEFTGPSTSDPADAAVAQTALLADGVHNSPKVSGVFLSFAPGQAEAICAAPDATARAKAAHMLRGGALGLGLSRLAEICGEIEGDPNKDTEEKLATLRQVLSDSMRAIAEGAEDHT